MLKVKKDIKWIACSIDDVYNTVLSCVGLYRLSQPDENYKDNILTHIRYLYNNTQQHNISKFMIMCNRNSDKFIKNYAEDDIEINMRKFSEMHHYHSLICDIDNIGSHTSKVGSGEYGICVDTLIVAVDNNGWLLGATNIMHTYSTVNIYTFLFDSGTYIWKA